MAKAKTTAVKLDDWELSQLSSTASANAMTYLAHYGGAGLFRNEIPTLNRWCALAAKLAGKPAPEPLSYRGIARNGFNPNGKD